MADGSIFETFEKEAQKHFQTSSFGKKANGDISFDLDWGTVGMTGKLTSGTFKKTDMWANDFADSINWEASEKLSDFYEASKTHPNGPVYRCVITFEKGRSAFRYYFENAPIQSLADIAKDNHDTYPLFAYRKYFTEELIEETGAGHLAIGHKVLIEALLSKGSEVPEHHMEFYALNDFISDFNNGGLNQYLARTVTWDAAQYDRVKLYPRLRRALEKLGRNDVKEMFDEAIALFAHYNEHVEEARQKMNISAVAKQEESDIDGRFWGLIDEIETETEGYMKANKSKFAYH